MKKIATTSTFLSEYSKIATTRMRLLAAVLCAAMAWHTTPASAQTYTHPTTGQQSTYIGSCMVTTCSGIYVDNGGAGSNYAANINLIERTFCTSNAGEQIRATFSSFSMNDVYFLCFGPNSCCDYLTIYDGPTSASPVLFSNCTTSPGTVTSTNGCLTFRFTSDGSVQLAGWNATISCVSGMGGPQDNTNSDCAYATPVCGSVSLNDPSSGPGIVAEGCAGCLVTEKYANWYKINVAADGTLAFTIDPNQNTDNFDFALYGPDATCGALGTPVRCSAAAVAGNGNTGLGNGAVDNSEDVTGDQWVAPLNVTAGQTYLLLVNGNSVTMGSNGFALNFTGNADISPASLSASISGTTTLAYGGSTTISFSGTPNATITYKVNNGADQTIVLNGAGTATLNTGLLTATTTYSLVGVALVASCPKSVSGSAVVTVCGGIIYVDADAAGANNGSSWTDAFTNLQDALTLACGTAEIWVAAGTYKPTSGIDRTISFMMKNGVSVYGGFAGSETMRDQRDWKTNSTILSGEIGAPGLSGNSYHVVFFDHASASTVLDGFTITEGNGEMTQNGGGIYNDGSGVGRQSNPRIANCTITGNVARNGGGLFNDGFRGNSSPEVVNCVFSGNKATRDGGAAYNFGGNNGNSSPLFTNVIFTGNKAERIGGGVFNDAVDAVGGVSSPAFMNCTFSGNQADFGVGGIYNDAFTGTCSPAITNCILWGNAGQIDNRNATPVITSSIVQNGYTPCTDCPGGDGNTDPLFVSQPPIALGTSGNLRLQACSPAIDAGTAAGAPATDLDGNARQDVLPGGGIVDIGAYEFQSNLGAGTVTWTGAADTDWSNPCNWDGYAVPGATGDVLIPDVTNDPVVMAGTTAVAKSVTINADAALTVEATGSLTINGFANNPNDFTTAGMHNSGTVTNDGVITLGSTASVSNHAIYNNGAVFNNAGAEMHLDRAEKNGIENNGAFTNAGKITIGAIDLGQFGILNKGTFDNATGAEIAIDRSDDTGLRNASGTFNNAGKITLGAAVSVGTNGLTNLAVFNNHAGGEINLDRSFKVGLYNNGAFTNEAKIKIGQIMSPGDYGLWQQNNAATFHNNAGGEIYIDRAGDTGLRNQFGAFTNSAKIVIGAVAGVGFDGIYNSATLNNGSCPALIHIVSNNVITNSGTFANAGAIIENASGNSSISSNTGVVQNLNGGTFTVGSGNAPITTAGDIWTGCTDTDWATATNWLDGSVPTTTDDAVIPDVTNDPVVMAGTAAVAQSVQVQSGGVLTIAATGSLTIEGATPYGSMYNLGTVTNNGMMLIGQNISPGLYGIVNEATFNNNADAEIRIDRTINMGFWNRTAAATLANAGLLVIGETAANNSVGLRNEGDVQNTGGEIRIDRFNGAGIHSFANSTFSNSGTIVVGKIATGFGPGIYNFGQFENLPAGEIELDRANSGIYNTTANNTDGSSFINEGKIAVGQSVAVNGPGIYNQTFYSNANPLVTFENKAGGEILLDRTSTGIHNDNNCSFDNAGLIKIATTAAGSGFNPGIYNRSTFNNNASGEIRMDSIPRTGLHHQSGTFTNGGKIIVGITVTNTNFSPGVYNQATFVNQANAELHIDRFTHVGFQNDNNASMTNAGLIKIGENVLGGNNGLYNNGTFDNQASGEIHVDNIPDANNRNGVYNVFNRTFTNAGKMFIGSAVGAGSTGLFNYGMFSNSGEITVDHVRGGTFNRHGLFHSSGTFTNTGKIALGSVDSIGDWGIYSQSTFNNNAGGEISIDRCAITGLRNGNFGFGGTFTNQGKLNIGANAGVGNWGIWNDQTFNNSGELTIDNAAVTGLRHQSNTFTNTGTMTLGGIANIGDWGLWNQSAFNNNAGGEIHIDRTDNTGLLIFSNTFTNNGTVTIGAETAVGDQAIYNQGTLANGTCAQLNIFAPLHNVSTLTNTGLFYVNTPDVHTNSGFTNAGIIAYPQGNPIPNVTNNEIIIASLTFDGCDIISPAFSLGNPVDFTILGVFTDEAATMSAGTYDAMTNTFTPSPILIEGVHNLFVKIEDPIGMCTRIIPWELTTQNCCDAPEAICKPYTAILGPGGTATVAPANVDDGSTAECGLQSMTVSPNQFDCNNLGSQTVTLTVTDINGDSDECTATVTVVDNSLPTITCPGPVTVTCASNVPAVNLAAVTASDNCGAPTKSHDGDVISNMTCANRFTITRTYRATDGSNNSTTCAQIITVYDDVKPNFTFVPANVTVQCNSIPAVGTPTASDGCGGSVMITYNGQTRLDSNCTDRYTLTRQWTATDDCGNTKTATQRISVIDSQKPAFVSVPANLTVQCDAIPTPTAPVATDNCATVVAISYIGETRTNGTCLNRYTLTRRWVAADNCGNTLSVSQRISVVDNGKPMLTLPADMAIGCSDPIPTVGTPTASDGCAGAVTIAYLGQSTVSGACPGSYQIKRIWRATDACGNTTAATQTIQVSDNGAPVFVTVPGPVTIECNQPLPPLVNPTASDACGGYVHITFLGNVPTGSGCQNSYTITRTWRADDLCGNTATATQLITVQGSNFGEEGAENRADGATRRIAHRSSLITHRSSLIVNPNPTTDRIWLDLTDFAGEAVTVSIFSDLGLLVWENRIPAVEELKTQISLREAGAAAGMYTVSVRGASGVVATRVVLVE